MLHQVSLLALRANDIQSAIPDITRLVRDTLHLHTVGIILHDDGWVIQDGHGPDTLSALNPGVASIGEVLTGPATEPKRLHCWDNEQAEPDSIDAGYRVEMFANDLPAGFIFVRGAGIDQSEELMTDLLSRIGEILVEASGWRSDLAERRGRNAATVDIRQLLDVIAQLATLTDIDGDVQSLLADIGRILDADLVSLVVSDPSQPELFMSDPVWDMMPDEAMQRLVAAPAVRRAVDSGQSQIGEIVQHSARINGFAHVLALPLVARGESVGVLIVERDNPFVFSDREAAEIIADHLSFSLDRIRRVRGYSRQNLLLSLVERVTAFIARSTDDDDLLARMAREIRRTFGYDCSIALIVGNRLIFRALELGSQDLIPDWLDEGIPLEAGVMGRVARTGQPAFVRNVKTDSSFLDVGRNTVSEIAVPIRIADQVVGVLNVESGADNPLQNLDFEILLILANHIGIALSNRQLIAAERESRVAIEAIQRVSTIVAETLDPEESLRLMAATLAEVLNYPVVSLALVEGRWLIRKANHGYDSDEFAGVMGIDEGISGRVARSGIPVLLEDVNLDPAYIRQRQDLTSEVCVPIRCGGEVAGVLNVEGNQDRPVTERDLHLLTTFAEHAGVLLNNARAYAELSREATLDPMTGVPNLRYFQQKLHGSSSRRSETTAICR
ncbi:MAG: GAF domain-containing protein [Thermomicrobiales bacterium]